ncbi:TPA: AHH domain-containing protein [Vibrio vulnificus]|nr:AHH domain-containing protein [Vibrio vulnificus]
MNKPYNPIVPSHRPSNPSPLELAIHRYEVLAAKHYNMLAQKNNADEKVKIQMEQDKAHLKRLRHSLSAQVLLQSSLTEYREECSKKSVSELRQEPHHPTTVLARNLTAIGEPKPSQKHDPHHIIMGTGRFRKARMMSARLNMHMHGIGINDPINGVWLPRTKDDEGHWATPEAPAHKKIHRYNYETWISVQLAGETLPEQVFRNRLRNIKNQLKNSSYPENVVAPKDLKWKGQ